MSTIAEKLIRLNQTKADIKAAIEEKGQVVGGIAFSQYANKVRAIKGVSSVTPSSALTTDVTGKLNRLTSTKTDIKSAIETCGVTVGSVPFSQYAGKIRAIQTGTIVTINMHESTYNGYFDEPAGCATIKTATGRRHQLLNSEDTLKLSSGETLEYIDVYIWNNGYDSTYFQVQLDGREVDRTRVESGDCGTLQVHIDHAYDSGSATYNIQVTENS